MNYLPDFDIEPNGEISREFLSLNIFTFYQAIEFIQNLKYGRNPNKDDLKTVFTDAKGTCSTKHALLKQLANENHFDDIKLMLGVFKMNAKNTPNVAKTLTENSLEYIPEAHNYLKYKSETFDFTKPNSLSSDFVNDLLFETEIQPNEINQGKFQIHRSFLVKWLNDNTDIDYSLDEIWRIREQCIQSLSE